MKPEIIIVDYGSNEHYAEQMKGLCDRYGWVYRYVATGDVWTYGIPANIGIRMAEGDVILATCIDYIFKPNFVETVLQYAAHLDVRKHLILCSVRRFPRDKPVIRLDFGLFDRITKPHGSVNTSVIGAHRDWWFKIHGFDERFRGWGEVDNDLVYRARTARLLAINLETGKVGREANPYPWRTSLYHQPHGYQGHASDNIYRKITIGCILDKREIKNDENWGTEKSPFFFRSENPEKLLSAVRIYLPPDLR